MIIMTHFKNIFTHSGFYLAVVPIKGLVAAVLLRWFFHFCIRHLKLCYDASMIAKTKKLLVYCIVSKITVIRFCHVDGVRLSLNVLSSNYASVFCVRKRSSSVTVGSCSKHLTLVKSPTLLHFSHCVHGNTVLYPCPDLCLTVTLAHHDLVSSWMYEVSTHHGKNETITTEIRIFQP